MMTNMPSTILAFLTPAPRTLHHRRASFSRDLPPTAKPTLVIAFLFSQYNYFPQL